MSKLDSPDLEPSDEEIRYLFGRPGLTLRGVAHGAVDGLIESFNDPAYRVQFFAGVLATVPCTRARLGFLPSFLISMAVGYAARWGYESVTDIRAKLDGRDADRGV